MIVKRSKASKMFVFIHCFIKVCSLLFILRIQLTYSSTIFYCIKPVTKRLITYSFQESILNISLI